MIEFKRVLDELLPYKREKYFKYTGWHGVSFQMAHGLANFNLNTFVDVYDKLFHDVIKGFKDDASWIVNHDDKDLAWFPNNEKNLIALRALFKQNNIPNSFKGGLVFNQYEILKFSKELITYPFSVFNEEGLFYKNLDISHSKIPFIIKITAHFNIDLLSEDKNLLREVINENMSSNFILKNYRGTRL